MALRITIGGIALVAVMRLSSALAFLEVPQASPSTVQETLEPRLLRLLGTWLVTASTFGAADATTPTFVATRAAGGRAVYSVWKQGSGAGVYEANALWGFDPTSKQIRVFEVNSLGVAEIHVGRFDESGALVTELRDPKTAALLQWRRFTWAGDTITMNATFYVNGAETRHSLTLVKR